MPMKNTDAEKIGVVHKKNLGHYNVHHDNKIITCTPSGRLRKQFGEAFNQGSGWVVTDIEEIQKDPVAIGDRVRFVTTPDGSGMVLEVLPRRNTLARAAAKPMPGAHAFEQVIAANLDQVIPVFAAADPTPRWHLLDRILVTAESYELTSQIVITKADIVLGTPREKALEEAVQRYRRIGYPVLLTSSVTGDGLEALHEALSGQTSVLVGKSGVGKTSLLNQLEPDLGLRVKSVNAATGKGRHTTSHLEMFPLKDGGAIVDTPGVREFGILGLEPEDIAYFFPEIAPFLGRCRFGLSCRHDDEPGCAVKAAVMDGAVSPYRYKSYLKLCADM
jgi:ribosome biogenesis GTPase / thiamine phosphate phosphatase